MEKTRREFVAGMTIGIVAGAVTPAAAAVRFAATHSSQFVGRVVDNNARPISKARIMRVGKVVGESGSDGFFSVDLNGEERDALTFVHERFVPNTRAYNGKRPASAVVVLWPVAHSVTFDAGHDFSTALDGSEIRIPASTLVAANGTTAVGPVTMNFTLFDVTSPLQRTAAPGDFTGRLRDRSLHRLNSYGIFRLDITDRRGEPLSVRTGASIGLSLAVPRPLMKKAPKEVGFYLFDTATAIWIESGQFTLSPTALTYNGSVTQSGLAGNLDTPGEIVCVTFHTINVGTGAAVPNLTVVAHGPQYSSSGTANANGDVCLLVERNASFWVEAYGYSSPQSYWSSAPWPQQTFMSPNFSSTASDCGGPLCPHIGCIMVDLLTGTVLPGTTNLRNARSR